MQDIEQYWLSFKYSWLRRLITTEAYWPNILLNQISNIKGEILAPCQLLQLGPCLLSKIGKSLKMKFWSQVLQTSIKMYEGAAFCNPEMIISNSFFYNPIIRRNNKVIKYEDFPELKNKICSLENFFHPGTNTIMGYDEFKDRYNINIEEINTFISDIS